VRILHRAVTSPVFELVKTVELDIRMSDEDAWTTRIEFFRDTERPNRFRCRVWESELFRLTPSFPRNGADEPAHISDDTIMVERGLTGSDIASILHEPFEAANIEAALEMIWADLRKFLEHSTGE
jgi:hypothetical protein